MLAFFYGVYLNKEVEAHSQRKTISTYSVTGVLTIIQELC